jgi:hypothetical protein
MVKLNSTVKSQLFVLTGMFVRMLKVEFFTSKDLKLTISRKYVNDAASRGWMNPQGEPLFREALSANS